MDATLGHLHHLASGIHGGAGWLEWTKRIASGVATFGFEFRCMCVCACLCVFCVCARRMLDLKNLACIRFILLACILIELLWG